MPDSKHRAAVSAASRAAAALFAGYAITLAFTAAAALLLQRAAGWARGEATITAAMLAFAVYLLVALRALAAPTVARAWAEPAAGALALAALARALA